MPDTFTVRRSTHIAAPAERIYGLIEDFRRWEAWSPWENLDPDMKKTFSGAATGVGAGYAWSSAKKAGVGSMRIESAEPAARIGIALSFVKPFPANNHIDFVLNPTDGGTDVAWIMTGAATFMTKVMGLFMNMDKMVGKDFEAGLANLKRAAEA